MKLNKDLLDALMMIGLICLVLLGTCEFENQVSKDLTMASLALFNLILAWLRIKASKQIDDSRQELPN